MRTVARLSSILLVLAFGCGDDGGGSGNGDGGVGNGDGGNGGDGGNIFDGCEPVDLMIVLDGTMSMHRLPDGDQPDPNTPAERAKSKWHIAVGAIESVTSDLEAGVRFGLSKFPLVPASGSGETCVTVEERTDGTTATNTQCQQGEVLVSPDLNSASAIDAAIDPDTTELCRSTPIGGGLAVAGSELAGIKVEGRDQYALLITDGQDTCDDDGGGYTTLSLPEADALFAAGVRLYVVGFDGTGGDGVDPNALNDLACAGGTAPNEGSNCVDTGGVLRAVAEPSPEFLFLLAEDSNSLQTALQDIAAELCCGCVE
ncbi:MAG: VWA domain-containing protein [Deltaproteobacteria bacterium]|nr:VWA domain-containing protein [Deltaproteobacteria bacterium]